METKQKTTIQIDVELWKVLKNFQETPGEDFNSIIWGLVQMQNQNQGGVKNEDANTLVIGQVPKQEQRPRPNKQVEDLSPPFIITKIIKRKEEVKK